MDQDASRSSGSVDPHGHARTAEPPHASPDFMQRDVPPQTANRMDIYDALTAAAMGRQAAAALEDNSGFWHDCYDKDRRVGISDDPSAHGGRVRGTPHVEGSFPSFAQIICKGHLFHISTLSPTSPPLVAHLVLMPGPKGGQT